MRQNELNPAYVIEHHELDPSVLRAQRMAELKDIAEWRRRRLNKIMEWSNPEKRAKILAASEREMGEAKRIWAEQLKENLKPLDPKGCLFQIRPITKPRALKWYQRVWLLLTGQG